MNFRVLVWTLHRPRIYKTSCLILQMKISGEHSLASSDPCRLRRLAMCNTSSREESPARLFASIYSCKFRKEHWSRKICVQLIGQCCFSGAFCSGNGDRKSSVKKSEVKITIKWHDKVKNDMMLSKIHLPVRVHKQKSHWLQRIRLRERNSPWSMFQVPEYSSETINITSGYRLFLSK